MTTTLTNAAADDNDRPAPSIGNQSNDELARTFSQLIAQGRIDLTALGLAPMTSAQDQLDDATRQQSLPLWFIVPGAVATVREVVDKTRRGLKESTARCYEPYLKLLVDGWSGVDDQGRPVHYTGLGDRLVHEILPSDLEDALRVVKVRALQHGRGRAEVRESVGRAVVPFTGDGAVYNAVGAWRRAFDVAVKDRHLSKRFNPAQDVKKPPRGPGRRRPLTEKQMGEVWVVVRCTGNDPLLDEMLVWTILIAGARREGLLNLTLGGIDLTACTLRLDEKFDKVVHQPVPDWLAVWLHEFAVSRGASRPSDPVFRARTRGGESFRPITSRRMDGLFQRVQSTLPWADSAQVTAHVLRHHSIALIERISSKAVAMEFARHAPVTVTDQYGRASAREVAQAVVDVHGGDHPLLHDEE